MKVCEENICIKCEVLFSSRTNILALCAHRNVIKQIISLLVIIILYTYVFILESDYLETKAILLLTFTFVLIIFNF